MSKARRSQRTDPRTEATCERMLEVGLALFSQHGFDSVSTRALAEAAEVNQAAIPYHFNSKEGLYHAVANRVVEMVRPGMHPIMEAVRSHHVNGVTDLAQARDDIIALILGLMRQILSQPKKCEIGHFMMREQMQPSSAFDIIYDNLLFPMHSTLSQLVAALRGLPQDSLKVAAEAHALFGEAIIFGAHRTTLMRRLQVEALSDGQVEEITGVVREMLERQFPAVS